MLSARSFGELVARYKYLHVLALRDRSLVRGSSSCTSRSIASSDSLVAPAAIRSSENRQRQGRERRACARSSASASRASQAHERQAQQIEDRLERIKATRRN